MGKEINPYTMLKAAKDYKSIADTLYDLQIQNTCSKDKEKNHLSVSALTSAILLYSLSIEIGLKAVIRLEGQVPKKSHNLKTLFEKLSETNKNEILYKLSEDRFKVYFSKYLKDNKTTFEDWRYFYEKANCANSDFLKALADAIVKAYC